MSDSLIQVLFHTNRGSLDEFARSIGDIYPQVEKYGVQSASDYVTDLMNRYANNAPYNYVSYSMIGGFFSDAQRRFVMASIHDGSIVIPYPRTDRDRFHTDGAGAKAKTVSDDVSMYYSMDDEGQSRMQALRGWGKVGQLLITNSDKITRAFELGVKDAITNMDRQFSEEMTHTAP